MDSAAAAQLTKSEDVRTARLELVPPPSPGARHDRTASAARALIRAGTIGLLALVQLGWLAVITYAVLATIR